MKKNVFLQVPGVCDTADRNDDCYSPTIVLMCSQFHYVFKTLVNVIAVSLRFLNTNEQITWNNAYMPSGILSNS